MDFENGGSKTHTQRCHDWSLICVMDRSRSASAWFQNQDSYYFSGGQIDLTVKPKCPPVLTTSYSQITANPPVVDHICCIIATCQNLDWMSVKIWILCRNTNEGAPPKGFNSFPVMVSNMRPLPTPLSCVWPYLGQFLE